MQHQFESFIVFWRSRGCEDEVDAVALKEGYWAIVIACRRMLGASAVDDSILEVHAVIVTANKHCRIVVF